MDPFATLERHLVGCPADTEAIATTHEVIAISSMNRVSVERHEVRLGPPFEIKMSVDVSSEKSTKGISDLSIPANDS